MSIRPEVSVKSTSLQGRFILASLLCLPLFIGASGLLLEQAFKENLLAAEEQQLQSQLYILLGAAEVDQGNLWLPEQLPEPRYSMMDSGLYGQIIAVDPDKTSASDWQRRWRSASARLLSQPLPEDGIPFVTNGRHFDQVERWFRFTYDLIWEDPQGESIPLRFQIFHETDTYRAQLLRYRKQLWYGLILLALGLISVQALIMRWGLRPLKQLVRDVRALPDLSFRQLEGQYPAEIRPLTDSLNQVLANEQAQRERYKNTLSDLAHSLKTPLAIVQGELQTQQPNHEILKSQSERMTAIIRHQLQRAVVQTNQKMHQALPLRPIAERLCRAMEKVYADKAIQFRVTIPTNCSYPMESQDFFELLGNLIENACKYGKSQVHIDAKTSGDNLTVTVADDGEGIPNDQSLTLLDRGARGDTSQPGQGIGLAITTDIISAYGGALQVRPATTLGGAEFVIQLPNSVRG